MPVPSLDLYVVKRAVINAAGSGNNTIVAAVSGKSIWVLSFFIISAGTVNATWQSGAGGTGLTGALPLAANTGVAGAQNPSAWFITATGALLNLSLDAAIQVSGCLTYIEV